MEISHVSPNWCVIFWLLDIIDQQELVNQVDLSQYSYKEGYIRIYQVENPNSVLREQQEKHGLQLPKLLPKQGQKCSHGIMTVFFSTYSSPAGWIL